MEGNKVWEVVANAHINRFALHEILLVVVAVYEFASIKFSASSMSAGPWGW